MTSRNTDITQTLNLQSECDEILTVSFPGSRNSHSTERKQHHNNYPLSQWQMQPPNHRHWHNQDPQIGEGANSSSTEVERHHIDTCPAQDRLIPEEGDRRALHEVGEEYRDGQSYDTRHCAPYTPLEGDRWRDPLVEKKNRGLT